MFFRKVHHKYKPRRAYRSISNSFKTPVISDTPLHAIIRHSTKLNDIYDAIKIIPNNEIAKMARTTNNEGDIPIDLIDRTNLLPEGKNYITALLLDLIKEQKFKPLNESLNVNNILQSYYPHIDKDLYYNLDLACSAANAARKSVKISTTHPDFNHFDVLTQCTLLNVISMMRNEITATYKWNDTYTEMTKIVELCEKYKIGNCYEFSCLIIDFLIKNTKKPLHAYIVNFDNEKADHVFVIFGLHPLTKANEYIITDTQHTFCDGWAGVAGKFIHDNLIHMLGDYKRYYHPYTHTRVNVVTTFNPQFHHIDILSSFNISAVSLNKRLLIDFGKFSLWYKSLQDKCIKIIGGDGAPKNEIALTSRR